MENEDESVNADMAGEEGPVQRKNHGFATHSSGTWDQDELISDAKGDDSSEDLPPNINSTEDRA
jgi:hypothetical protein